MKLVIMTEASLQEAIEATAAKKRRKKRRRREELEIKTATKMIIMGSQWIIGRFSFKLIFDIKHSERICVKCSNITMQLT